MVSRHQTAGTLHPSGCDALSQMPTPRARCCAGVSKCGTTDLYKKLLVLPHVQESRNKGPHFWDEAHDFPWYLDLYDDVAAASRGDPMVVSADASSNTFTYAGVGIRWVASSCGWGSCG